MKNKTEVLKSALALASQGITCFPCNNEKRPTCLHGFKDATADPESLRKLWCWHPGQLVGVPTGAINGFDVLDIDSKHCVAHEWWVENRKRLPPTRVHRTRSGGLHVLFKHVQGLSCSVGKIARGIDIRTTGGYVVWWPAAGYPVLSAASIADAPAWLIEALRPLPAIKPELSAPAINGDRRALQGLIRTIITAKEGERNSITFWAACRAGEMVAAGNLTNSEAIAELSAAAIYAGLSEREAIGTINSGLRGERR